MNAETYARVKALFHEAVELDPGAWGEFVRQHAGDDAEVRAELEALLEHHQPGTILEIKGVPAARPPARIREATSALTTELGRRLWQQRRVTIGIALLLAVLLAVVGWLGREVQSRFDEGAGISLQNALWRDKDRLAHWTWIRQLGVLWSRDPLVRHPLRDLSELGHETDWDAERLRQSPRGEAVREGMAPHLGHFDKLPFHPRAAHAFVAFDYASNRVLAASEELAGLVGLDASLEARRSFQNAKAEGPISSAPRRLGGLVEDPSGSLEPELARRVVTCYGVPVYYGTIERVMALEGDSDADPDALLFVILTPALELGRLDDEAPRESERHTDVFLFNTSGELLSNLKDLAWLDRAGLLAEGQHTTALELVLKDPGRPWSRADGPVPHDRPLTTLAQSAISQRSSPPTAPTVLLEPYRDITGRDVIGAWMWIEGLDACLAIEAEASYVSAAVEKIHLARNALVLLILAMGAAGLFTSRKAEVLVQEVDEGQRMGQYLLLELIGEGGLGRVYKARHARMKRLTAVKLLRPEAFSDEALARFEREVRLTSQLTHPNTIAVYDYGTSEDGQLYYAMEYLDGITLSALVEREGPLPVARVLHLLIQVLGSLAEAHRAGLVHRDIKPANVMVSRRGGECDVVKVLDFGLVKCVEDCEDSEVDLTRMGTVSGTPLYIAPERLRGGEEVDGRSDLYSVGTLAYLLLTGRAPFRGENRLELCLAVLKQPVPRVSVHAPAPIPEKLDDLIAAAMAKRAEERPESAEAMIALLEMLQVEHPWTHREAAAWWDSFRPPEA